MFENSRIKRYFTIPKEIASTYFEAMLEKNVNLVKVGSILVFFQPNSQSNKRTILVKRWTWNLEQPNMLWILYINVVAIGIDVYIHNVL